MKFVENSLLNIVLVFFRNGYGARVGYFEVSRLFDAYESLNLFASETVGDHGFTETGLQVIYELFFDILRGRPQPDAGGVVPIACEFLRATQPSTMMKSLRIPQLIRRQARPYEDNNDGDKGDVGSNDDDSGDGNDCKR